MKTGGFARRGGRSGQARLATHPAVTDPAGSGPTSGAANRSKTRATFPGRPYPGSVTGGTSMRQRHGQWGARQVRTGQLATGCSISPVKYSRIGVRRHGDVEAVLTAGRGGRRQAALVTLKQFVDGSFRFQHVWALKHAGKLHYEYILDKHVLLALGEIRLR